MWLRVDQSDLEPMITPTSALIIVPLIGARRRINNDKPRNERGLVCLAIRRFAGRREGRAV
ncbi:hypothetical protein STUTZSP0542_22340 [Stutzerimonas marianensis]